MVIASQCFALRGDRSGGMRGAPLTLGRPLVTVRPNLGATSEGPGRRSASQAARPRAGASRGWFSLSLSLPQQQDWFQKPEALKARVPSWVLEPSLRGRPDGTCWLRPPCREGVF